MQNKDLKEKFEAFITEIRESFNKQFTTPVENKKQLTVTERIKSFEDACRELGISPDEPRFTSNSKDTNAYEKLKVIITALNEGWTPDWKNEDETKYYPYFNMNPFSYRDWSDSCYCISDVGARLCYKTKELCIYAAEQFKDIYEDFFLG